MKKTILLSFLLTIGFAMESSAQNTAKDYEVDHIIDTKGVRLNCKITKVKNGRVRYRLYKKSQPYAVNLMSLKDIYMSDPSVLEKPTNRTIEKPAPGFAHVYLFSTKSPGAKVHHNGEKLIKIKAGSYYLHKIKVGGEHVYSCKQNYEVEKIKLTPKSGEIFFIHPELNDDVDFMSVEGMTVANNGVKLKLNKDKVAEYAILTLKKELTTE